MRILARNPFMLFAMAQFWFGAVGVSLAYLTRKFVFTQYRSVFGYAAKADGKTVYYAPNDEGTAADTTQIMQSAFPARIAVNLGQAMLGAFMVGKWSKNQSVSNIGRGMVVGALSNLMLQIFTAE